LQKVPLKTNGYDESFLTYLVFAVIDCLPAREYIGVYTRSAFEIPTLGKSLTRARTVGSHAYTIAGKRGLLVSGATAAESYLAMAGTIMRSRFLSRVALLMLLVAAAPAAAQRSNSDRDLLNRQHSGGLSTEDRKRFDDLKGGSRKSSRRRPRGGRKRAPCSRRRRFRLNAMGCWAAGAWATTSGPRLVRPTC